MASKSSVEAEATNTEQSLLRVTWSLNGVIFGIFALLALAMRVMVARPLSELAVRMGRLTKGDLTTAIDFTDRDNEIGAMAKSLQVFLRDAKEKGSH